MAGLPAALEGKETAADAVQKGLGRRGSSVEDLRSIVHTTLSAHRWQSKTVSKALPALAPFVPRMLRDDLLTAAPKCLAGAAPHFPNAEDALEDDSKPLRACCCMPMHILLAFVSIAAHPTRHLTLSYLLSRQGSLHWTPALWVSRQEPLNCTAYLQSKIWHLCCWTCLQPLSCMLLGQREVCMLLALLPKCLISHVSN